MQEIKLGNCIFFHELNLEFFFSMNSIQEVSFYALVQVGKLFFFCCCVRSGCETAFFHKSKLWKQLLSMRSSLRNCFFCMISSSVSCGQIVIEQWVKGPLVIRQYGTQPSFKKRNNQYIINKFLEGMKLIVKTMKTIYFAYKSFS